MNIDTRVGPLGAHPRSRGENPGHFMSHLWLVGSSPLTRGKRPAPAWCGQGDGLIPAHAGKTGFINGISSMIGAHPRSRGENDGVQVARRLGQGSSPLTRGKPRGMGTTPRPRGLIPAHAGKTAATPRHAPVCRAHPRSRGENDRVGAQVYNDVGSSPLTRGKPRKGSVRPHGVGLIPAHAGKTRATTRS